MFKIELGEINMKKPGFTLEEHDEVGSKLRSIRNELVLLGVKIANAYPRDVSDPLTTAIKRFDRVRSNLDDIVCKENPDLENSILLRIYF